MYFTEETALNSMSKSHAEMPRLKYFGIKDIEKIPELQKLSAEQRFAMRVVSTVLPFRVNNYVIDNLIDWDRAPDDPIYRMTFMDRRFLTDAQFDALADALRSEQDSKVIAQLVGKIRSELNPHPAGQLSANVPDLEGDKVPGIQHKYTQTALVFPSAGQTCFTYCTFCFRWPQFIGDKELKFSTEGDNLHLDYLRRTKSLTDVLITGGDPMTMRPRHLRMFIEPLLGKSFEHIRNIRIGTKVLSYWPYRFLTDPGADEYLELFEKVNQSGKQLALMAHFNHPIEISTDSCRSAISRLRAAGVNIRTQSPLLHQVNDSAQAWQTMWEDSVQLGMIPYYMFVERDTGPKHFFEVPLIKALDIYNQAYRGISGLGRTVRGPSMSTTYGKIMLDGVTQVGGEKAMLFKFLQGRNPAWAGEVFFAKYDEKASWVDDLQPLSGDRFFFQD